MNKNFKVLYYNSFYKYMMSIFELLSCRTKPEYQTFSGEEPKEVYFKEPIKRKF